MVANYAVPRNDEETVELRTLAVTRTCCVSVYISPAALSARPRTRPTRIFDAVYEGNLKGGAGTPIDAAFARPVGIGGAIFLEG